jgi:MFS family permease
MTDTTNTVDQAVDPDQVRRRVRRVLMTGQVLSGVGMGQTLSVGALLATDLSGSPGWSGMAATLATLGSAAASIPLARLAARAGRSWSLAVGAWIAAFGAVTIIVAAVVRSFPLLLVGIFLIGVGTAVNLQARFAATDLSTPKTRATDLSLVVWATTVGAVGGPNLVTLGETWGVTWGLPALAGPFLIAAVAQLLAGFAYRILLRPDPLVLAAKNAKAVHDAGTTPTEDTIDRPHMRRLAFLTLALSHATMASVMAMTPVHLVDHGASLAIVGFTISLHIAGMFALSPVFGLMADRFGRVATILIGQVMLAGSLLMTGFGSEAEGWVVAGLIFLGLGWSAATVSASALLTESTTRDRRTVMQGRSDVVMSGSGALGAGLSGVVLLMVGYSGLSLFALLLVAGVVAASFWAITHQPDSSAT